MNGEKKVHRIRWGVLDIFIIAAILACVVGVGLRIYGSKDSVLINEDQLQPYTVQFSVKNIRMSSVNYLTEGAVFYIDETGDYLGTLIEAQNTPAMTEYVTADGQLVYMPNTTEMEQVNRVDATGSLLVNGIRDANGFFKLNGNRYLGPNEELVIRSRELLITVRIESITP